LYPSNIAFITYEICFFFRLPRTGSFENPARTDQLESVKSKIEVVKSSMKENIQALLANDDRLERIESATVQLGEQSMAFRNSSKALNDKMWWQMWKTRLIIIAVIIAVLLIIIVPIAVTAKK
jgi:vesicle-associated membrane protein 72